MIGDPVDFESTQSTRDIPRNFDPSIHPLPCVLQLKKKTGDSPTLRILKEVIGYIRHENLSG